MDWRNDDINLNDYAVAVGKYGGPIAFTRDMRKILRVKTNDSKQFIYIYTCSGKLLSKFEWAVHKKGVIAHMFWSYEEHLVLVSKDAVVYAYDIHGRSIYSFSLALEIKDIGILQIATWSNGIAILTSDFKLWVVEDLETRFCEQYARIPVTLEFDDEKDIGMSVIPPEQSVTGVVEVVLSVPQSKSIFLVSKEKCRNMDVDNGPHLRVEVSPSGDAIATFTDNGGVWVVKSDFTEKNPEFGTKSSAPPYQMAWCGEDCVCLYWNPDQINRDGTSLLLMIGRNGEFQKFTYDGSIHLVSEIDGIRIITNETCEFLQRVPEPTYDIFRIGSLTPSAMLYDAYIEFEKKNASSIKIIRSIKAQLPTAVRNCLSAALHEFNPQLQRSLLKAASYGKSFCEEFNHEEFIKACKIIRIMNAVWNPDIGIPITFEQYERLTADMLIERLFNRYQHLLAYRICNYLQIKPVSTLVHWACEKVKSDDDDQQILKSIQSKLKTCDGISYATVASAALKAGKKELAICLLEKEERAREQVPILLNIGETKKALKQAIISGETDLLYLVLLHMRKKLEPSIFFSIINEREFEIAKQLLITYCKEQDIEFLKVFYHAVEMPQEAAIMDIYEYYQTHDFSAKRKLLNQAKECFSKKRECLMDMKLTEQQRTLLEIQQQLDQSIGKQLFTGLSVSDTIYNCILIEDKIEAKLKSDFNVPDKRYWWIKIAAYSKLGKWNKLENFSKKKSPIGYKPFVEACMKRGNSVEALKYIPKVTDPWEKVELYVALAHFKEAIEIAYSQQDIDMLRFIKSEANNSKTKQTVDELITKLGG
jgi:hypothetical protein